VTLHEKTTGRAMSDVAARSATTAGETRNSASAVETSNHESEGPETK